MPSILDTDLSLCEQQQREEYEVLESIYPDSVSSDFTRRTIHLEIVVEFGEAKFIDLAKDLADEAEPAQSTSKLHGGRTTVKTTPKVPQSSRDAISALPPIILDLVLPTTYPTDVPPHILDLSAMYSWLPRLDILRQTLLEMWRPGETVLYDWVEFIRSGEFMNMYGLSLPHQLALQIIEPDASLKTRLLEYDQQMKLKAFQSTSFTCPICLSSLKGSLCIQLSCSHVFCRACLSEFWSMCIIQSEITKVGCMDQECKKSYEVAAEDEVTQIVSTGLVSRWKFLKEKREFDIDPSIVYCPRCQNPVKKPSDFEEGVEIPQNKLRICEVCTYTFCSKCNTTWHGVQNPCYILEAVIIQYATLPENSPLRRHFEEQYDHLSLGMYMIIHEEAIRAEVLRAKLRAENEVAYHLNEAIVQEETVRCPKCVVPIFRISGCNHMICSMCHENFCYACGRSRSPVNPHDCSAIQYR